MPKIVEIIKRRDGHLHIIRHENSLTFLWRTFLDKKYFVRTTKETNRAAAIAIAETAYDELRFNKKQRLPIHLHTFDDACREMLAEKRELVLTEERSATHLASYETKLRVFEPFFEKTLIHKIDADKIQ